MQCFLPKKIELLQAKISALKELVRQSEEDHGKNTVSAQEKVKNIAQRLTHLKSKATRSRQTGNQTRFTIFIYTFSICKVLCIFCYQFYQ